jgi:two-component system, sensor histidine kinase and response regulator
MRVVPLDDDDVYASLNHSNVPSGKRSAASVSRKVAVQPEGVIASGQNLSVLVVDDSDLSRKMVCRLLRRRCGYLEEACDGRDALEKIKASMDSLQSRRKFNLVLIDYEMPNLSGPEAVKQMRANGFSGVVIGLTGHVESNDTEIFLEHGANHVFHKPFDVKAFDKFVLEARIS